MRRSKGRNAGGTETARSLDLGRLAEALQRAGIDPRVWASYGTVCTQRDDGTYDFTDPLAVAVSPGGCFVDVLLHPLTVHVTCRYPGMHGGSSACVMAPIKPGDEVVVSIPDGDLRLPPVIEKVMTAQHSLMPTGPDGKPIWQNDQLIIHSRSVKLHLLADGGAEMLIENGSKIVLNASQVFVGGESNAQPAVLGQTLQDYLNDLTTALANHVHLSATPGNPTSTSPQLINTTPPPTGIKVPNCLATNAKVK